MKCAIEGCRDPADAEAPLPLCAHHHALACEWPGDRGVDDALPGPCALCGSRLGVRMPSGWLCGVCEWRYGDLPDAELPSPRVDVVYYLRYADRVKIGTTARPRSRFSAIRHDELLAFERGDRMQERRRHAQFAVERFARTEWFALSDDILALVDTLRGGADPWDRYARWRAEAVAAR